MGNPTSTERVSIVAGADVGIDIEAIEQLEHVAGLPRCVRAVGMPDLHPGPGIPIGAAFAFADRIRPALVGSDAGCGARLMAVDRVRHGGDALERRIRAEMAGPALPEAEPQALLEAVWRRGLAGLCQVAGVPDSLAELAKREAIDAEDNETPLPAEVDATGAGQSLGTIGGGNHFAEVSRVDQIVDRETADALGLVRNGAAVLVHTGSRGLGRTIAARWGTHELEATSPAATQYLGELRGACHYAQANRLILAWRLLRALGEARASKIAGNIDITHNTVSLEAGDSGSLWIHRKGCAPAHRDQTTLVLGSRGAPSWVMRGCGQSETLCSVAHGAGRRLTRAEARSKIRERYRREALRRTATGGRVICDETELLLEEHPDAYKPIEPVVTALVERGMARRVAALLPLVTVKQ